MNTKARVIAFYLPQFHPIEVNDRYWGKGFTEWTNVTKAKPMFPGHKQPQLPADLGFYDLRLPQVRQAQADMAREAGIEGFCYWNYYFGHGKKVLDLPLREVLERGEPDFPFCVGWANHDWSNKTWQKSSHYTKDIVFLKQEYLGEEDYTAYFYELLPYFMDKRYIRVENKPLFYIFDPESLPDPDVFISCWQRLAKANGMDGVYIIARADPIDHIRVGKKKKLLAEAAARYQALMDQGYNGLNSYSFRRAELIAGGMHMKVIRGVKKLLTGYALNRYDYAKLMDNYFMPEDRLPYVYPTITPRKDKTPRGGRNALVYSHSTPEKFRKYMKMAIDCVKDRDREHRIIILDSWNEWGEGSFMEPDLEFGHAYLDVLREEITE